MSVTYYLKKSVIPGIPVPDNEHTFYLVYRWLAIILVISVILVGVVEFSANMMHNNNIINTSKNASGTITLVQVIFGSIIVISSFIVGIFSLYFAKKYNTFAPANNDLPIGLATFSMYVLLFAVLMGYGLAILIVPLERASCINNNSTCISTVPHRVAGPITLV